MTFAIETRHLAKHFPKTRSLSKLFLHPFRQDKIIAIRDMNFRINRGEIFCLLGPNGANFRKIAPALLALTAFSIIVLPISLWIFGLAVKKAERDGSLTHY